MTSYIGPVNRVGIWLYCCIFAVFLPLGDSYTGDASRYVEYFKIQIEQDYSFSSRVQDFYTNASSMELLPEIIYVGVGFFTDSHLGLLLCFGIIFGFFYSGNAAYLSNLTRERSKNKTIILLLIVLNFLIPVWSVNGFRFWTASLVFIYAALPMLMEKRYTRWPCFFVSALLHSTFIFVPFLFLAALLLRGFFKVLSLLLLVSLVLKFLVSFSASSGLLTTYLPDVFYEKYQTYVTGNMDEGLGGRFIGPINFIANVFIQLCFVATVLKTEKNFLRDPALLGTVSFATCVFIVTNLFSSVPVFARFYSLGYYFSFLFLYLLGARYNFQSTGRSTVIFSVISGFIIIIVDYLSVGYKMTGLMAVISPFPLSPFLIDYNVGLGELFGL